MVLIPLSDAERELYKNLRKNPLRIRSLGKRKWEDLAKNEPVLKDEPFQKRIRGNDVSVVIDHCERYAPLF